MIILSYLKVAALSPIGAYIAFVIASLISTGKPDFIEIMRVFIGGGYIVSFIMAFILGLPYLTIQSLRPVNAGVWLPILICLGGLGGYFVHLQLFGKFPAKSFVTEKSLFIVSGACVALTAWLLCFVYMQRSFKTSDA